MSIPRIPPYPQLSAMPQNRVDWQPDPARAVLLIHDMQQYFLDFYDGSAAPIPALLSHIGQLREACDAHGIPVFYSAQPGQQSLAERGLLQDWWGAGITAQPQRAGIVAPLAPRAHDTVLTKWRYSAFVRTDLQQRMQQSGRDQILICGVYAHIGCLQTAADAFMHDIQSFLIGDAVADFSAEEQQMALDYVAGRCGVVMNTEHTLRSFRRSLPLPPMTTEAASAASTAGAARAAQSGMMQDPGLPASLAELRLQVGNLLQMTPQDVFDDDNLLYAGLDSVRLMHLLERWRRAGAELNFVEMAQNPTLNQWWNLISRSQS